MKRHIASFFILSLLAIVLTACSEDIRNGLGLGHEIAFKIMPSQPAATRSAAEDKVPEPQPFVCQGDTFYLQTEITPMDSTMGRQTTTRGAEKNASNLQTDGFKVSAYNTSDGTTRGTSYFEYLTATYADSKFTPQGAGTAKYWPTGKLMFYAYYPAATASNGITQGANASTLTYTVPSTPANQPDLMTARATDQQYTSGDGTAALTFNHALCAIKFQTGTDIAGGTINSITFNNIYTSGTYNLDTQTWSSTTSGNKSFTGLSKTTTEGTSGTAILTGDNTLMMIPQTFDNNNQTITINFTVGGTPHTLSYVLNGTSWGQGQCITYTITTAGLLWEYYIEATGSGREYTAGNVTYTVKSWRQLKTNSGTKENVAWEVESYSTDGGATWSNIQPAWLTVTGGTTGTGGTAGETKTWSITAQSAVSSATLALRGATSRGTSIATADCFDLSRHSLRGDTTVQNTANCYVVNAPGYYKIPLVYGNGIKNGAINTSAYNSSSFVDYNGTRISTLAGPYLKHSGTIGTTGSGAPVVIWQDVSGLVSSLAVDTSTDNGYLKFYVNPSTIAQGNAVIAVRNSSGTIMWSWHIWVTPHGMTTVPVTQSGTAYTGLTVNLGWSNLTNVNTYPSRYVRVRVKQTGGISQKKAEFIINQYSTESILSSNGYNPFYQWGRKDPFIPNTGADNQQHTAYGTYTTIQSADGPVAMAQSIKAPQIFYKGGNWCSSNYNDLWCVGNSTVYGSTPYNHKTSVKSVYDPCPVGFKVCVANFYNGLSRTSTTSYGSYYTCSSGYTIYFPWTGYITYNGATYTGFNAYHTYTSATPASDTSGEHLTSTSISVGSSSGKAQGFTVRPMGE